MNNQLNKIVTTAILATTSVTTTGLLFSRQAYSASVYNNLNLSFDAGFVPGNSNTRLAQQFILDNTNGVDQVILDLFGGQDEDNDFGKPTGTVSVEIWEDDINLPVSRIGTVGILDLENNPIVNTGSQLEIFEEPVLGLINDQPYWVVLNFENANIDPNNSIGWNSVSAAAGTNGAAKALASPNSGETWSILSEVLDTEGSNYFQMSVNSTSVPEPSFIIGLLGVAGILTMRRLKK